MKGLLTCINITVNKRCDERGRPSCVRNPIFKARNSWTSLVSHFESQRLVPKELQSGWHNPQKVVDMEPYKEKQLLGVVPSTLKPLYLLLFSHQGLFFCDNASETNGSWTSKMQRSCTSHDISHMSHIDGTIVTPYSMVALDDSK